MLSPSWKVSAKVLITHLRTRDTGNVRSEECGDDLEQFSRNDYHVMKCHKRPHEWGKFLKGSFTVCHFSIYFRWSNISSKVKWAELVAGTTNV
jgi:hypothetical protein